MAPIAYVSLHDVPTRMRVHAILEQAGWTVLDQPTGFHVLQALSGLIEGDHGWVRPGLIVIDAFSRGCAGTTIAAGLRELGIAIPIVLVTKPAKLDEVERVVAEVAPNIAHMEQSPCGPTSTSRMSSHAA